MVREILIWPDPVLSRKCEAVELATLTEQNNTAGSDLRRLLDDMVQTMLMAQGSGLAAPQVGFALRAITILTARTEDGNAEVLKLVNPKIVAFKGIQTVREGCLSLPGYFEHVKRAMWVKVEALDENGAKVEVEGDGKLAQALQHEIEHLDGVVFADHLSVIKRNLVRTKFTKAKAKGLRYSFIKPEPQDFTARPS